MPSTESVSKAAVVLTRAAPFSEPRPIHVDVSVEGLMIAMPLEDFAVELARSMGSPAFLLTKTQLLNAIMAASWAIVDGMKAASPAVH